MELVNENNKIYLFISHIILVYFRNTGHKVKIQPGPDNRSLQNNMHTHIVT